MKNELNNYNITNADSSKQSFANEGKLSFDNDKRGFICENAASDVDESARITETFDEKTDLPTEEKGDGGQEPSITDASSASSASTASSATSAASASVGGGLGALAGVVAASVAAAVVVVAVFVSTLAIHLSLLIADMHSLTFGVSMTGAQEEDFETPIYAILTGEDISLEQEVTMDTQVLAFDDLVPGKEYRLVVKNDKKVFAEVTAYTTTEPNAKGEIVSHMEGTEVFVTVRKADLKASEFYTLVGKDAAGNVVFSKDSVETMKEYSFTLDEPKDLYFYLIVSGKTYAISQIEMPDYDLENGVWAWSEDYTAATVTFADKRGGESLVLNADVTRKRTEATCDADGSVVYTAKAVYEGKTYTKKETMIIESLGHDYEGIYTDGQMTFTCSRCGDTYTD